MKRILLILLISCAILMGSISAGAEMLEPHNYFQFGFDEYVFGVPAGTKCSEIISSAVNNNHSYASVLKANGTTASDDDLVCTGMQLSYNKGLYKGIAVYGDVDGNGAVNVSDQIAIKNVIMSSVDGKVNSAKSKAADMDYSGTVNVSDTMLLKNFILSGLGSVSLYEATDAVGAVFNESAIRRYMTKVSYSGVSNNSTDAKDTLIASMRKATVFGFGGHGYSHGILLQYDDKDSSKNVVLTSDEIDALPNGALSSCRLAYFNSCSVAATINGDCFLQSVYDKGAKTAIGFRYDLGKYESYWWNYAFFQYCSLGHTIEDACFEANFRINTLELANKEYLNLLINGLVILGDKQQRLAQPLVAQGLIDTFSSEQETNPMESFDSNMYQEINEKDIKGYYDLSVLHEKEARGISTAMSRQETARNALNEYIDIDEYTFDGEGYNQSLEIYTLNYSKHIDGLESADSGFVMINKNGNVIGVKASNISAFDQIDVPAVTGDQIDEYVSQQTCKPYTVSGYSYGIDANDNIIVIISVNYIDGDIICVDTVRMPLN